MEEVVCYSEMEEATQDKLRRVCLMAKAALNTAIKTGTQGVSRRVPRMGKACTTSVKAQCSWENGEKMRKYRAN